MQKFFINKRIRLHAKILFSFWWNIRVLFSRIVNQCMNVRMQFDHVKVIWKTFGCRQRVKTHSCLDAGMYFSATCAVCDLLRATVVSNATLSTPCDASTRMFLTDNTYSTTRYSPEKCCSLRHTVDTGYATTASTWMWRLACCVWVIVCNARMLSSVRRAVRRILCRSTRRASKRQRLLTICRHWQRVCCRRVCFSFHSQGRSLSAL